MLTQGAFERLLDRWIGEGRIAADQRAALLADAARAGRLAHPATVTAVFGASLVILAVLAFVAANWQGMPRLLRLGVLLAGLGLSYGGAIAILRPSHHHAHRPQAVGHALLLVGAGLFGVSLALVSQMYHVSGSLSGLLGLWGGGALATAVAARSRPPLWLAGGLFTWMGLEGDAATTALALGLVALVAVPVGLWRLRSEVVGVQLAVVVLAYSLIDVEAFGLPLLAGHLALWAGAAAADDGVRAWPPPVRSVQTLVGLVVAVMVTTVGPEASAEVPALIATVVLAALAGRAAWWAVEAGRMAGPEGVVLMLVAALAVSQAALPPAIVLWLSPAVLLAAAVLFSLHGARTGHKGRLALGVFLFMSQAAVVYLRTDGSLMAASGFFLVGGVVLAVVAVRAGRAGGEGTP